MLPPEKLFVYFLFAAIATFSVGGSNETVNPWELLKAQDLYSVNCTKDSDCFVNSYCHYGRCTCKVGFTPYKETRKGPVKCIKQASDIEDYCEKDIQCQVPLGVHAFCQIDEPGDKIGKCNCTEDAHYVDSMCHRTSYIGQACEVNDNCFIRNRNIKTFCDYGHCICPPRHHAIDGGRNCVPTSELNGPCMTSDSCITSFSECMGGFCLCKENFIMNFDNSSCLEVADRIGDPCLEDRQCLLNIQKSWCDLTEATCACQEGHHELNGECWKTANLLTQCMHTNECRRDRHHGRGIHCSGGFCLCMDGFYISDERKFCISNQTENALNGGSGSSLTNSVPSIFVALLSIYFIF